ncbi:MAG TPA: hypothetical protein VD836_05125 [Solirubrobacteraceae bacterium]|nr:hypothetical protein [Solirubrobacteraceae bacterium]
MTLELSLTATAAALTAALRGATMSAAPGSIWPSPVESLVRRP